MDHYGQHSLNSVTSSMNLLNVNGVGTQNHTLSSSNPQYYPSMPVITPSNDDFFQDFVKNNTSTGNAHPNVTQSNIPTSNLNIVPVQPAQPSLDQEVLSHLRTSMTRMMSILERLEQRVSRVEQSTAQILKNQQESFQVPFMSQKEIDTARQLAEQLEQDSSVAKQLQAAYNKEIELKKRTSGHPMTLAECPVCGARVNQLELEGHVEQCLDMFSNDPKKQAEVKETKQKMETGFFGKFFNKTKTETTTTTKVISRSNSTNMPEPEGVPHNLYPAYGYPQFMPPPQNMHNINGVPMMMPMYMYPGYPGASQQNE